MKNTTLCYIEKDDCYLMLYRNKKPNDPNAGKWIGVGGNLEENESPDECVVREVLEETGLHLKNCTQRGIITFVSDEWEGEYMHLFTASSFTGSITECDEGELRWIKKDKIEALPLWEGDKIFLKLLQRENPFFLCKLTYSGNKLTSAVLNGEIIKEEF